MGSYNDAGDTAQQNPGGLSPAVFNILIANKAPLEPVDEVTQELHMSARQGAPASRSLLHALSKESLDVLRAERIARRMARESALAAAAEASVGRVVAEPIEDVRFDIPGENAILSGARAGGPDVARRPRVGGGE